MQMIYEYFKEIWEENSEENNFFEFSFRLGINANEAKLLDCFGYFILIRGMYMFYATQKNHKSTQINYEHLKEICNKKNKYGDTFRF